MRTRKVATCQLDNCSSVYYAKNMCRSHYDSVAKAKRPRKPVRVAVVGCLVPECSNKHAAHGFCRSHHKREDVAWASIILDTEDFWLFVKKELNIV